MGKQSKDLVAGCVVLVIVGILPAAGPTDRGHPLASPSAEVFLFEGKPLSAWVTDLKSKDPDVRLNAAITFRRMGPKAREAMGALVRLLKDEDPLVERYATDALARIGRPAVPLLITALSDPKLRLTVLMVLSKIGPDAEAATRPLVDLLRELNPLNDELGLRNHVCAVLGRIGRPAVAPAVRGLKDKDPEARRAAAVILKEIGPAAEEAVAPLVAALADKDDSVRARAADALGEIHRSPATAIPALTRALQDEDEVVRAKASGGLTRFGKAGISSLLAALKDRKPEVRLAAARVLGQPGCQEKAVVKPLLGALGDRVVEVRQAAALALEDVALKESAEARPLDEAIPALASALKDPGIRSNVARVLAGMGGMAIPALVRSLTDEDEDVRKIAAWGLGRAGPKAGAAVAALIARLKDRSNGVRACAVEALGSIGPAAKDAVPALARAMKDRGLRKGAVEALSRIEEASLPVLLNSWAKAHAEERTEIAHALAMIGPKAGAAVPLLIEALDNKDVSLREAAACALGCLGKAARPAVPRLIALLQSKEGDLHLVAIQALASLGPEAETAIPALAAALRDSNEVVRWYAACTLGDFGPRAKDAVPSLIAVRRGAEDPELRYSATQALWTIDPAAARKAGIPRLPAEDE